MNLQEFAENVVKKTLFVDDNWKVNKSHMALGFASEFCSELFEAEEKKDLLNISEEIGDMEFFILGYMLFEGMTIPEEVKITQNHRKIAPQNLMRTAIGNICTVVKKELISGQPKLNGKVLTIEDKQELAENLLAGISIYCKQLGIGLQSGVRPMIANKLNVRYDGGGFSAEKSLNRNIEAETFAMQSSIQFN